MLGNAARSSRTASVSVIEPPAPTRFPDLHELITHREVLYFLVRKGLTLRYKQTVIGVLWVLLQPLSMMLVFTLFFGEILGLDSNGLPFPVFVYPALVAWQYFSGIVNESIGSVARERELMKKIYVPKLIFPLVPVMTHVIDLVVSLALLVVLMVIYQVGPRVEMLALPLFFAVLLVLSTGVAVWLSALNVTYRDVPYAVPFVLQLLFFMSPVFYSINVLEARWRSVYDFNPLSSVIEGFRWSLVGGTEPSWGLAVSAAFALIVLVTGLWYFGSHEAEFVSRA